MSRAYEKRFPPCLFLSLHLVHVYSQGSFGDINFCALALLCIKHGANFFLLQPLEANQAKENPLKSMSRSDFNL
jgi:hypothetical protein